MTTLSMKDVLSTLKNQFKNIRWNIEFTLFKNNAPIERVKSNLLIVADEDKNEITFVGDYDCDKLKWTSFIEWRPAIDVPKGEYPALYLITEDKMGIRDELFGSYHDNQFIRFDRNEQGTLIDVPVENVKYWAHAVDRYSIGE